MPFLPFQLRNTRQTRWRLEPWSTENKTTEKNIFYVISNILWEENVNSHSRLWPEWEIYMYLKTLPLSNLMQRSTNFCFFFSKTARNHCNFYIYTAHKYSHVPISLHCLMPWKYPKETKETECNFLFCIVTFSLLIAKLKL